MTLIKTSLLNAIAVGVRMLTLLGINKILAIYVGPAGYAALGQFQNVIQMIITLASGGINTGVTKYTAQYHDNESEQRKVWKTAGTIALSGSFLLSCLVFIFREPLALGFLGDARFSTIFVWFSATLLLFVLNTLMLAILNGKKDITRYVLANIAGSVLGLGVTTLMVVNWGLLGALTSFAVYQSLAFFATLFLCLKTPWFRWSELVGRMDLHVAKDLGKYTFMALTTAATAPLTHIFIRDHLGEIFGIQTTGYWEAMSRLSGAYLLLISTTLSIYYLPRLSELKTLSSIKQEIKNGYIVILPATVLMSLCIYFSRDFIISTLFSDEFKPMEVLFFWQLVGDVLKISSWIISFLMLSRAMTLLYILSEIVFSFFFYFSVKLFVEALGFYGVSFAYAVTYAIYCIVIFFLVDKNLKKDKSICL